MWKWLAGGVVVTWLVSLGEPSIAAGHGITSGADLLGPQGNGPGDHRLLAVEDVSAGDVWAAGFYNPQGRSHLQLLKHYDGNAWHSRTGPSKEVGSELRDFQSFGPSDVWMVGDEFQSSFIGHWDGMGPVTTTLTSGAQARRSAPRCRTGRYGHGQQVHRTGDRLRRSS